MARRPMMPRPAVDLKTLPPEAIMPLTDFREDPFGDGNSMTFRAGVVSVPVPAAFAQSMRDQGLVAPK